MTRTSTPPWCSVVTAPRACATCCRSTNGRSRWIRRGTESQLGRSGSIVGGPAGPGPKVVDVVLRGTCSFGGIRHGPEVAGGGQPALVRVEDVEPGHDVLLERVHAHS